MSSRRTCSVGPNEEGVGGVRNDRRKASSLCERNCDYDCDVPCLSLPFAGSNSLFSVFPAYSRVSFSYVRVTPVLDRWAARTVGETRRGVKREGWSQKRRVVPVSTVRWKSQSCQSPCSHQASSARARLHKTGAGDVIKNSLACCEFRGTALGQAEEAPPPPARYA